MKKKNSHLGSKFTDFLKKEMKQPVFKEEFEKIRLQLSVGNKARKIVQKKGLSIRALAKKMATSISQVTRLMNDENVSLDTLSRFAAATGVKLNVELR